MKAQIEIVGLGKEADSDKVFIIDCNEGQLSVTNDAEDVVKYVLRHYPNKRIIYRDSEMQWDELTHEYGEFVGFRSYTGWTPFNH